MDKPYIALLGPSNVFGIAPLGLLFLSDDMHASDKADSLVDIFNNEQSTNFSVL